MTSVAELIQKAHSEGVRFNLLAPDSIKLVGKEDIVQRWLPVLRPVKPAVIEFLQRTQSELALARELMVTDGLPLHTAEIIARSAAIPRSTTQWLALIAELDSLIEEYCKMTNIDPGELLAIRRRQSLASIPETLSWFRAEVSQMKKAGGDEP